MVPAPHSRCLRPPVSKANLPCKYCGFEAYKCTIETPQETHRDHQSSFKAPGMTKSEERDLDDIRWCALMLTTMNCLA